MTRPGARGGDGDPPTPSTRYAGVVDPADGTVLATAAGALALVACLLLVQLGPQLHDLGVTRCEAGRVLAPLVCEGGARL